MAETAYPTLGKIEDIFRDLVWDNLVEAGIASLFVAVPALAVWPLGPIIRTIAKMFASKLFDVLRLAIDLGAISFVNAQHRRAFDTAMVTLNIIAHDKGIDSKEFLNAKQEAKIALSKFVRFGAAGV